MVKAEENLTENPQNEDLQQQVRQLKQKIEIKEIALAKGAQI